MARNIKAKSAALNSTAVVKTDNADKAQAAFFANIAKLGEESREFGSKSERCQFNAAISFAAEMVDGGLLHGVKDAAKLAARAYNPALKAGSEGVLASEFNSFVVANGADYSALDNPAARGSESLYRAALKLNRAIKRAVTAKPGKAVAVTESFVKAAMAYKAPTPEVKPEAAAKSAFDKLIAALAAFNAQALKLAPLGDMKAAQAKVLRKILDRVEA